MLSYWAYILLCLVIKKQRHYIYFLLLLTYMYIIDLHRLHVNFDILVILFSLFLYMFFDAALIGYEYVSVVIIPRI